MTEDEAKEKWCPFASKEQGVKIAGGGTFLRDPNCIASACMAWRWVLGPTTVDKIAAIKQYRVENPGSDLRVAKDAVEARLAQNSVDGYCGLAGALR